MKSAVYIKGSLNDPADQDNFWSVELAIPWEVLSEANTHDRVPEDEFWRINFSRVNWQHELDGETYSRKKDQKGAYLPEYNWVWSPQWVINMHEPEKWGYVYFSSKEVGEQDHFSIPEDERVKWLLYDLYRAQKVYLKKNGRLATTVSQLDIDTAIAAESLSPELEIHKSGWNIFVESPFTGAVLGIKEDGKFIIVSKTKE